MLLTNSINACFPGVIIIVCYSFLVTAQRVKTVGSVFTMHYASLACEIFPKIKVIQKGVSTLSTGRNAFTGTLGLCTGE